MTAVDYNQILIEQQQEKIEGLQETLRDMEQRVLQYEGALKDARNDLIRLFAHRRSLTAGEAIPALYPEHHEPGYDSHQS